MAGWLDKYFSAVVRCLGTNLPMRGILEVVGDGVAASDETLEDGTPVTRITFTGGGLGSVTRQGGAPAEEGDVIQYISGGWWATAGGGPGPSPPALLALSHDLADGAGGESVIATLDEVVGTPTVTVGGTPATVTAYDGLTVTFTMPAKAAGLHNVVVTTSGGASSALPIESHGKAVKFAGSQSYSGAVSSGAVATARVRFRIDTMPDKTFRIIAGTSPGNVAGGWMVVTNSVVTGITPAVGQLVFYATLPGGGIVDIIARKFLMPADIGRTFVAHIVANGTDVRVYIDGMLLDLPVAATGITAGTNMLIGGRVDGTVGSNSAAVLDVAEGTTAINAAAVAIDAASPVPAFAGQTHRYVANASVGASWADEVGTAHLSPFGSPTLVTPRGKYGRFKGIVNVWGDSIAAGRQSGDTLGDGWRRAVERALSVSGVSVALRGFASSTSGAADYDIWHSATGGESLHGRKTTLAADLPVSAPADAATILAYGINDIVGLNRTAAQLQADVTLAVGYIASARPGRPIFVANMLPRNANTGPQQTQWQAYQDGFASMISTLQATYPQVVGIDYASAVTNTADVGQLYDGTHPTPVTYAAMANVIGPIVSEVFIGPPPPVGVPVLVSLSHDLVDTVGGDTVVCQVTAVTGIDRVQINSGVAGAWVDVPGGAAAIDDTHVTFLAPPLPAGNYLVRLVSVGGTSGTKPLEAWSPVGTTGATCLHRWRPDLGVTTADGYVSVMLDQVGAMHQRQPGSDASKPMLTVSEPTFGDKPVLFSGGSGRSLTGDAVSSIARPVSMLVIGVATAGAGYSFISTTPSPYDMFWRTAAGELQLFSPTAFTTPADAATYSAPLAALVTDDGTNTRIYVNDLTTAKATSPTHAWGAVTSLNIMRGTASVSNLNGKLAECIIWSGVLSAGDRTKLAQYIRMRYGLTVVTG